MYLNRKAYELIEELSFSNFFNPFVTTAKGAKNFATNYFNDVFNEPSNITDPQVMKQINKSKTETERLQREIKKLELDLRSPGIIDDENRRKEIEKQLEEKRKRLNSLKTSKLSLVNYYYKNAFGEKAKKGLGLMYNAIKDNPIEAALTAGGLGLGGYALDQFLNSDFNPLSHL